MRSVDLTGDGQESEGESGRGTDWSFWLSSTHSML
jgi:hypothetical protein